MLDKIKERLTAGLFREAYDLERIDLIGQGNKEERDMYCEAEAGIGIYSRLLHEFFPDVDREDIEKKGTEKAQADYEEIGDEMDFYDEPL